LGIGDWGLGIGPNTQSPIPNPQLDCIIFKIKIFIIIVRELLYYVKKIILLLFIT